MACVSLFGTERIDTVLLVENHLSSFMRKSLGWLYIMLIQTLYGRIWYKSRFSRNYCSIIVWQSWSDKCIICDKHTLCLLFLSIGKTDMSLVDRIKKLEDRILYLEGISPEYFNASNKPLTSFNSTVSVLHRILL